MNLSYTNKKHKEDKKFDVDLKNFNEKQ